MELCRSYGSSCRHTFVILISKNRMEAFWYRNGRYKFKPQCKDNLGYIAELQHQVSRKLTTKFGMVTRFGRCMFLGTSQSPQPHGRGLSDSKFWHPYTRVRLLN